MIDPPFKKKMVAFALPLMLSGILQQLFHSADLIVVGQFSEAAAFAQAAISSTAALVNLIIAVFMGLSVGINVAVAKYLGARDDEKTQLAVHTAICLAVISGLIVGLFGFVFSDEFLELMQSPTDVISLSTLYLKIFFLGAPFNLLYNFGAAILRAKGDTLRPLLFLSIAGATNVVLNLFFVLVLKMDVDGVAIATVVSQALSSMLVFAALLKEQGPCGVKISKLKIDGKAFAEITKVGLPAGIQGSMFSISNVLLQSSINSFGPTVMAGNGNAQSLEGFIYFGADSVHQAAIAFISQNYGAKKEKNIYRVMNDSVIIVTAMYAILSTALVLLRYPLLQFYSKDQAVNAVGSTRILINTSTYVVFAWYQVSVAFLRGTGKGTLPMVISVLGICAFRVFWIYTVFPYYGTLSCLYYSYPISWALTGLAMSVAFIVTKKKTFEKMREEA